MRWTVESPNGRDTEASEGHAERLHPQVAVAAGAAALDQTVAGSVPTVANVARVHLPAQTALSGFQKSAILLVSRVRDLHRL